MFKKICINVLILTFSIQVFAGIEFLKNQSAYVVTNAKTELEKNFTDELCEYLQKVLHVKSEKVGKLNQVPEDKPCFVLLSDTKKLPLDVVIDSNSPEAFAVVTGEKDERKIVLAAGNSDMGLKQAVHRMVIKGEQKKDSLFFSDLNIVESPWIPQREWTISYWSPQLVRGIYANPFADLRLDIYRYGDSQLERYADMFDWFGFNGCQLTETCNDYASFGTIEAAQEWQKSIAKHIRDNGQNISLFVWAAGFTGYGWSDPEADYHPEEGMTVVEDPKVRATFERYYDTYANLAPYVDMVIAHCYDPGHLEMDAGLKFYLELLEKKFRAKNSKIKMSVDTWGQGPDFMKWLAENGFGDYLLLANSMPVFYKPGDREKLHKQAKKYDLDLGIWGWWITECESDQLASMYVTPKLLKNFYNDLKDGVFEIYPVEYWSEMESNHLVNIYSLYAAGQLLFNPDRDPNELMVEITEAIWGKKNGAKVYDALMLIQDLRSGDKWQPYWWGLPEYNMGSGDPKKDLKRANSVIKAFETIEIDQNFVPKIPLPVSSKDLLELIIPHLKQIEKFCEFRCKYQKIKKSAENGKNKKKLKEMLLTAWQPVPEYNTWIGNFGQIELRLQRKMVHSLADEIGIEIQDPEPYRYRQADRLYQYIKNMQKKSNHPLFFRKTDYNFGLWNDEHIKDRYQKLEEMGLIKKERGEFYRLTNWRSFIDPAAGLKDKTSSKADDIMNLETGEMKK